jgi:hypothetical protein
VPLSTSLFSVHCGVNRAPAEFGLTRYNELRLPDWARSLRDIATCATMFAADPSGRMPIYGVVNYGAIDSGLSDGGPTLVTAVGVDRLDNWAGLTPQQDSDRRARWCDAFQAALDRDYPGFGSAVTERQLLSARSTRDVLNTPDGAVYGLAPLPMKRSIWAGLPRSPRTPVAGIYLASSFAGAGGFTGAMGAGAAAARLATAGQSEVPDSLATRSVSSSRSKAALESLICWFSASQAGSIALFHAGPGRCEGVEPGRSRFRVQP